MHDTSFKLLERVRNPEDAEAWREFVGKYRPLLLHWCKAVDLQDSDAENVVQNVLRKLVVEMQRFEFKPGGSFRGWLYRVAKNATMDYVRSEQRNVARGSGDSKVAELLDNVAIHRVAESLSDGLFGDMLLQAENSVRRRVSDQTWQVYCRRKQGQSAELIANALSLRIAAVYKAQSRVIRMIREEIRSFRSQEDR